jgi:hypothetical protein
VDFSTPDLGAKAVNKSEYSLFSVGKMAESSSSQGNGEGKGPKCWHCHKDEPNYSISAFACNHRFHAKCHTLTKWKNHIGWFCNVCGAKRVRAAPEFFLEDAPTLEKNGSTHEEEVTETPPASPSKIYVDSPSKKQRLMNVSYISNREASPVFATAPEVRIETPVSSAFYTASPSTPTDAFFHKKDLFKQKEVKCHLCTSEDELVFAPSKYHVHLKSIHSANQNTIMAILLHPTPPKIWAPVEGDETKMKCLFCFAEIHRVLFVNHLSEDHCVFEPLRFLVEDTPLYS